jgi:hypothetical protein
MKTCYWFGGSIVQGIELEKCGVVEQDRFTVLVSRHFNWIEKNCAQQGASIGGIADQIFKTQFKKDSIVIVVVPSHLRYHWVSPNMDSQSIMPSVEHFKYWYRDIDNFNFRKFVLYQNLLLIKLLLEQQNIEYYFVNEVDSDSGPDYGVTDVAMLSNYQQAVEPYWLLNPNYFLLDALDWDFNKGYPTKYHEDFFPCENHPNVQGHRKLANKIILLINNKISISKEY